MFGRLSGAIVTTRSRTIAAPGSRIWDVIDDPHHQPRWWPGVERVEGVAERRFTQVMRTRKGRPVRIDFSVVGSDPPSAAVWRQELAGSPFARVLESCEIEISLAPADGNASTAVTLTQRQRLRGSSRTGGFMLRRATRGRLDEALAGLAAVTEAPAE